MEVREATLRERARVAAAQSQAEVSADGRFSAV